MTQAVARLWGPVALALFVSCVWLNQGVGGPEWDAYHDRVVNAPREHLLDAVHYPFAYIYRRASDVQLYYELTNLMLGRPADLEFLSQERGQLGARFDRPLPRADGRWHAPYAEVPLEYPAAALPLILAPRLLVSSYDAFGYVFSAFMGLCLVGAILVALDAARVVGVDLEGLRKRGWLASGLILAQGAIAVQRLDAFTALCLALALRAAVSRRHLAFGAWAGVATATKFVPAALLPAVVAADADAWRDPRALSRGALGFAATLAAGIGPMFFFSPHALGDVIAYHAARGLHCESSLGFLLATWRLVTGSWRPSVLSFGSYNLVGPGAAFLAALCGPLSVVATLVLAWRVWRATQDDLSQGPSRVAAAAFAALVVVWLTAKVFSTQYMTWAIPVVVAIPGRLGVRLAWMMVIAMALTQFYVCGHHELVMQGRPLGLLNLGAKLAVLAIAGGLAVRALVRNTKVPASVD